MSQKLRPDKAKQNKTKELFFESIDIMKSGFKLSPSGCYISPQALNISCTKSGVGCKNKKFVETLEIILANTRT